MSFKSKMDNGDSVNALIVGDSLTAGGTSYYPYRFATRIAAAYSNYRVVLKTRTNGSMTTTDNVIQVGGVGAPVCNVYVDGISGATSARADNKVTIFSASGLENGTLDLVVVLLGINNATFWYGHYQYSVANYLTDMRAFATYPVTTYGAEVAFITPVWNESHLWADPGQSGKTFVVAAICRAVAREKGAKIIDARALFEDHCLAMDAQGMGGQGTGANAWLGTDWVHPVQAGHYAIGDELFDVIFA